MGERERGERTEEKLVDSELLLLPPPVSFIETRAVICGGQSSGHEHAYPGSIPGARMLAYPAIPRAWGRLEQALEMGQDPGASSSTRAGLGGLDGPRSTHAP